MSAAVQDAPVSETMPSRNPATSSWKLDPELLAKAKKIVPWLKGDFLKEVAPALHAEQEATDGPDVTLTAYFDYLIRDAIDRDFAAMMAFISKTHRRKS